MRYGWTGGVMLALAVLAGCAQAPTQEPMQERTMTAIQAIEEASRVNGTGVSGRIAFEVKAVGTNGEDHFLNSELDYRNPRSLNVRMSPQVREQLEARLGGKLDKVLVGRRVLVTGTAARVRIHLLSTTMPNSKEVQLGDRFYYQTHVHVKQADQIQLM